MTRYLACPNCGTITDTKLGITINQLKKGTKGVPTMDERYHVARQEARQVECVACELILGIQERVRRGRDDDHHTM